MGGHKLELKTWQWYLAWLPFGGVLAVVLFVHCNAAPSMTGQVDAVFPETFRTTFTVVRDCRPTITHASVTTGDESIDYIRVWANDVAAQPYEAESDSLPIGSVVVKESFSGADCAENGTLEVLAAMRKEEPGFDPDNNDWHWQLVSPDHRVVDETNTTCVSCHGAPECLARDYMCTER